ncbi:hypothetical protein NMY22_g15818 [Coprinellus aureogranulatus]|nr:hypothetical protein NMY22_g15818 [Coprinellus aureogranulatus]
MPGAEDKKKRRERVHAVDPPADRLEVHAPSRQSVANSPNAYKPYPYPRPSQSYSPRPQTSFLHGLSASSSSYQSELSSALLEASPIPPSPIAQSLPLSSAFEYRRAASRSSQPSYDNQYLNREGRSVSRDSIASADSHSQWWNTPYSTVDKSLSSVAMGGSEGDEMQRDLGGTKLDPLPIAPRPSYAASLSALNDSLAGPSQSNSFYNARGQYVAAPQPGPSTHLQPELPAQNMGSYDLGYSSHNFPDFGNSFSDRSSDRIDTAQSSMSWDFEELALHQPLPQHPHQQGPSSQQRQEQNSFSYHSPIGILDLEDRQHSEYR